ncbi:MAG: peptidoglycan-associated lipoprotein Pal [Deltaproteobacteria bacterium]|nr:peptidoglycan-associated lipoprotein Pal [Deltaproteobacteria bacterium]
MYAKTTRYLIVLFLLAAAFACSKKTVPPQPGLGAEGAPGGGFGTEGGGGTLAGLDDAKWRELGITSEQEKREFLQRAEPFENEDIFFDYDSYVLSEPAKRTLDKKVDFIKRYPKVKVTIEGHCDERGTTEYNLALGERRANAAFQYVTAAGANRQNLGTISYGKERPIATGHDEASWAKNRRAHFALIY